MCVCGCCCCADTLLIPKKIADLDVRGTNSTGAQSVYTQYNGYVSGAPTQQKHAHARTNARAARPPRTHARTTRTHRARTHAPHAPTAHARTHHTHTPRTHARSTRAHSHIRVKHEHTHTHVSRMRTPHILVQARTRARAHASSHARSSLARQI